MELHEVLTMIKKDQLIQIVDSKGCDLFKGILSDMSLLIYSLQCEVEEMHTDHESFLILQIEEHKKEQVERKI